MQLQQASRQQSRIKMAIQGPSGSGKTYSSLLMAKGLVYDWSKVAVIDTETGSSNLYSHLGDFFVLQLSSPHSPERYNTAITTCLKANIECVVIDSISHCWEYLLDVHANMTGNSFTNWAKITPRQQSFVKAILQSDAHVIATMRTKQDYVLQERNGKQVPQKVGLKAIQRDGIDYDFTLVLDLDLKHSAQASKDRTGLFMGNPEMSSFCPAESTGELIRNWASQGQDSMEVRIRSCRSIGELTKLYMSNKPLSEMYQEAFSLRKAALQQLSTNGIS